MLSLCFIITDINWLNVGLPETTKTNFRKIGESCNTSIKWMSPEINLQISLYFRKISSGRKYLVKFRSIKSFSKVKQNYVNCACDVPLCK